MNEEYPWDNRILDFDGENHICIGRTAVNNSQASARITYLLEEVEISETMINGEVWVPLSRAYLALEALDGEPIFCRIIMNGNWSADAPAPNRPLFMPGAPL